MSFIKSVPRTYTCTSCNVQKNSMVTIKKHFREAHWRKGVCKICNIGENSSHVHAAKHHVAVIFKCNLCRQSFDTVKEHSTHISEIHPVPLRNPFLVKETAFKRKLMTFTYKFDDKKITNLELAGHITGEDICALIKHQLTIQKMLRFSIIYVCEYVTYNELGEIEKTHIAFLRSTMQNVLLTDDRKIKTKINQCNTDVGERHDAFLATGSGWSLNRVASINVEIGQFSFSGGCKENRASIAKWKFKYLVDPETLDNECFLNCISLAFLNKDTWKLNEKRLGMITREYAKKFNTNGLRWPLNIKQIPKFERINPDLNIHINVFSVIDGLIIPIYKSTSNPLSTLERNNVKIINLFLQQKKDGREHHYIFISELNRFLARRKENNVKNYHCAICLNSFTTSEALETHDKICSTQPPGRVEYPEEGAVVSFHQYAKTVPSPIFGVCDFEASLVPVTRQENGLKYRCTNCAEGGDISLCTHQMDMQEQVPTTYSIALIDNTGKILYEKTETDNKNVMNKFFTTLTYMEEEVLELLQQHRDKKDYTHQENKAFKASTVCYLCKNRFILNDSKKKPVRDHCHYSGKYLGAAHSDCNWKRTQDKQVSVYIHNFKNYDSHFILQGLKHRKVGGDGVHGLATNMEKFRMLTIGAFRLLDSFLFLNTSLHELVSNLANANHTFPIINAHPFFKNHQHNKHLLLKKGVFPYEWASSPTKLKETTLFPAHEHFYSSLSETNISIADYEQGKEVYTLFNCRNMLDYCELYCLLDTLFLAEIMSTFAKTFHADFQLDPTKYVSLPQLCFDAMLRTLKRPIGLMTDPEMILWIEDAIRGGVSFINERHVLLQDYLTTNGEHVEDKKQDQLIYIDANNLYSVAQSCPLPIGSYSWMTKEEVAGISHGISNIPINSKAGFILEVDLSFPPETHNKLSSLPLAPTKTEILYENLSSYTKKGLLKTKSIDNAKAYKSKKLVSDLQPKKNYVLHYRNLQTYIDAGAILTKVHRGIKFEQEAYLRTYIDFCTKKRAESENPFDKLLWKLCMNAVYGKFIQNNRNFIDAKVCNKYSTFSKYFNSPLYKGHCVLSDDIVVVYSQQMKVKLNRPYAVGFSILELSKNHMYKSWYGFIQRVLGENNVSVVLSDTDSLLLHVTGKTRTETLDLLRPCMDFSNYPKNHHRYSEIRKGIPGFFKDESKGHFITESIGLRSKCYALNVTDYQHKNREHVVCKGITKAGRNKLTLNTFRNVVLGCDKVYSKTSVIRSKKHDVFTQNINKIALTNTDDKRYILSCGIHTIPYGSNASTRCLKCRKRKHE